MLDYTKIVMTKIKEDINRLGFIFAVISQCFAIAFLIYALCANVGILWVNIVVLVLSVACLGIQLPLGADIKKTAKARLKKFKRYFKWISLTIRLLPVATAVYTLCATGANPDAISVLLTAMTLISWVLQLVFQIVTYLIDRYSNLVREGLTADVEDITRPIRAVTSFFKKSSESDEEIKTPSKTRLWLDKRVAEARAEKAERKEREKQEKLNFIKEKKLNKKQEKIDKRNAKKQEKANKKLAKAEVHNENTAT